MGDFLSRNSCSIYVSSIYFKYGSEQLKQKYLPGIISGDLVSCIELLNLMPVLTQKYPKAELVNGEYVINGSKTFITNGIYGDFVVLVVKTDATVSGGFSLICVI